MGMILSFAASTGAISALPVANGRAHVRSWSDGRAIAFVHERYMLGARCAEQAARQAADDLLTRMVALSESGAIRSELTGAQLAAAKVIEKRNAVIARVTSSADQIFERLQLQAA